MQKQSLLLITLILLTHCISALQTQLNQNISLGIRATTCPSTLATPSTCTPCTLTQWAQKIFSLKERPIRYSTLPRPHVYQQHILTLSELTHTLEQCTQVYKKQLGNTAQWLDSQSLTTAYPQLFNIKRQINSKNIESNFLYKPYAQRLLVPPQTTIICFGDLHGSIHSLMRDMLKLKAAGILNDQFQLRTDQQYYMLFLGDYTDRGIYGTECLYTLARLKIANQKHVIIMRGNHEDYILQVRFEEGYYTLPEKDRAPSFLLEVRYKFATTKVEEIIINRINDLFPIVAYLGCQSGQHTDFVQCCHGGLDLGYNPQKLLVAPNSTQFQLISIFERKKNFRKLSLHNQQALKLAFDIDALCTEVQDLIFPTPYFKLANNQRCYTGFMWDDFYVDLKRTIGHRDEQLRGWVWGREFAHELLSWGTTKTTRLRGILRGHQHNNETGGPMLDLLCCNRGLVDVWSDKSLFTLVSAPDAKLATSGEECYTYDSFALLTVAEQFTNWRFDHYYQDRGFAHPVWQHKSIPFSTQQTTGAHTRLPVLQSTPKQQSVQYKTT